MKPYIYSVCDTGYRDRYADVFLKSARAHGHEAEIFCTDKLAASLADRVHLCAWRFQMLPQLLREHGAVLMLDIDSVIQRPLEIDDEYDLGLFLRPEQPKEKFKTLCSILYCTDRAMNFAEDVAAGFDVPGLGWCDDQGVVWRAYAKYAKLDGYYNVKRFDEEFISWRDADAAVFTGKGPVKAGRQFNTLVEKWASA